MSNSMDGFSVSAKAAKESRNSDAVKLGLKLQRIESFPCKMMMVHHDNHHRPLSSYEFGFGDGYGPTCKTSDIYDDVVAGVSGAAVTSGGAVGVRTLQPFDISPTVTTQPSFKFPGGMAASLGYPFTNAQWKELERQAMIYKYILASLPVPSDLLISFTRNSTIPAASLAPLGSGLNLRYSNGADPEPGRCRRTDGKKWRCSRDVAPDQKYCERHMHRGRPRSRKPVELPANSVKKTRHNHVPASPVTVAVSNPTINSNGSSSHFTGTIAQQPYHHTSVFLDKSSDKAATLESLASASSYEEARSSDWMTKEESFPTTDQQWHHLIQQTRTGLSTVSSFCHTNNASLLNHHYEEEPLNLNSYAKFSAGEDQQSNECPLFLNPGVVSLEKLQRETTRGFIDAWSNGVSADQHTNSGTKSSVCPDGKLSLSSLTLSMGGNNYIDDEMGPIQMGLGVSDQNHENGTKPHLSSWHSPASWATSTPGGPLAEVLRQSTVSVATGASSNPSSPTAGNGDFGSPPATVVSSPSGVLQKTPASLSDSSGSSSPTIASSRAENEITLPWLNQTKLATTT